MVPPFQEREVDKYFLHFEKVAKNCNWPKESWTMLLQSVLLGKAWELFSQLTVEDSGEYDTVKQLILKGYELVPEAYRQTFCVLCKSSNKTFVEFVQEKAQLLDRWCTSENVENKFNRPPPKPTGFISSSNMKPEFHSLYERQQPKQPVVEHKQYIHKEENEFEVKSSVDPSMLVLHNC
ncbi:Hypothetical predicted protein [Paramuricea clavata]|uniref:Uncharacterized protein n=1 Tax=Paramuricea clavata TaxID=317549 RepID=A0A6S7GZ61_PARCT|nr:Hypothetical predicted protein [Paramuricea clavata]